MRLTRKKKLLYIESKKSDYYYINEMLNSDYDVMFASNKEDACLNFSNNSFDIIIFSMDDSNTMNELQKICKGPFPISILITDHMDNMSIFHQM